MGFTTRPERSPKQGRRLCIQHINSRLSPWPRCQEGAPSMFLIGPRARSGTSASPARIQLESALSTLIQLVSNTLCPGLQPLDLCSRNSLSPFHPPTFSWLTRLSRFRPSLPGTCPVTLSLSPPCAPRMLSSSLCPCPCLQYARLCWVGKPGGRCCFPKAICDQMSGSQQWVSSSWSLFVAAS